MKQFSILIFLLFSMHTLSQTNDKEYTVLMDRSSGSVEKGMCMVYGTVTATDGSYIDNGQVVTNNYEYKCTVRLNGTFKLIIPSDIKNIYFVSNSHHEVSVLNYDFKSQHKVKINFNSYLRPPEMEMTEKPVIYLYSNDTTSVHLALDPTGDISFSYPKYKNGWDVKSTASGKLIHNKKPYPYLFWEGEHKHINFTLNSTNSGLEGYYIQTDTCIEFLENTLSYLGLNATESTDFITYWGPRLQQKPYAFIQFKELEAYATEVAALKVTPQPNSIQRIFMIFEGLESDTTLKGVTITKPQLTSFNRWGFTLIEWGGSEVNQLVNTSPINL